MQIYHLKTGYKAPTFLDSICPKRFHTPAFSHTVIMWFQLSFARQSSLPILHSPHIYSVLLLLVSTFSIRGSRTRECFEIGSYQTTLDCEWSGSGHCRCRQLGTDNLSTVRAIETIQIDMLSDVTVTGNLTDVSGTTRRTSRLVTSARMQNAPKATKWPLIGWLSVW
jgi:hypothetical protein